MLSFVRAFATVFSALFAIRFFSWLRICAMNSSTSIRAYHTSSARMPANCCMAVRYAATVPRTIARRCLRENPLSRPATSKLTASRFTSHSHGPGSVSSKSFRSNTSRRSGAANNPKFDRCASPHSWACSPELGLAARSAAISSAAPR